MKQWLPGALSLWFFAVLPIFVLGLLVPAWPSWLELPWSDFADFAATADGKVLVYSAFFSRLLVYDTEGRFVVSRPGLRSNGWHRLAVDRRGRVYLGALDTLCVLDLGSASEPHCQTVQDRRLTGWRLNQEGEPEPLRQGIQETDIQNRPAGPGEILMAPSLPGRRIFAVGGPERIEVRRTGDRLIVRRPGKPPVHLSTPWYLYWAKYPFPGFLAWVGVVLVAVQRERGIEKRRQRRLMEKAARDANGPVKE